MFMGSRGQIVIWFGEKTWLLRYEDLILSTPAAEGGMAAASTSSALSSSKVRLLRDTEKILNVLNTE